MGICVQRAGDGSYRVCHRPPNDKYLKNAAWLPGPVYRNGERLYYVREGLGDTWIIFSRDDQTGKQVRYSPSVVRGTREEMVADLHYWAKRGGWREIEGPE